MIHDFTFMIKTLLRPEALGRLLPTLRAFYPDTPVMIADDSPDPYPEVAKGFDCEYFTYPYDIGIGHCYNDMLDKIKTPGVVLLDDDFIFSKQTEVEKLWAWVASGLYDLVGGRVWNTTRRDFQGFVGFFYSDGENITSLKKVPQDKVRTIKQVDITMNFWAASTESLRRVRWNEELKVCRHEDFFLRYLGHTPTKRRGLPKAAQVGHKHRVGFYPQCIVTHDNRSFMGRDKNHEYIWHRKGRFDTFRQVFIDIWGFEFV